MAKNDEEFKDLKISNKIGVIVVVSLLILLVLGAIFSVFFFGFAGLFSLSGVEYESFGSLFLYVIFYFLISFVLDLFAHPFAGIISEGMGEKYQAFLTRMIIESTFTWLVLHTIDEIMSTISVPLQIEIIAAILIFLAEYYFGDEKKEKNVS